MIITVWAGSDIYSEENVDNTMEAFQEVQRRLQPALVEEFGEGVELVVDQANSYHISADKVQVS